MTLRMRLPSGARVRIRQVRRGPPRASDEVDGVRLFGGRALGALLDGEAVVEQEDGRARVPLDRAAILALPLRDFHALRDALGRLGVVAVERGEVVCRNCDEPFEVDLGAAPAEELEDRFAAPEPWESERVLALGAPVRVGRARARDVTMREVRVDAVRPFWRALARRGPLRVTPALVRAMGVVRLGEVAAAGPVARALASAPDAAWAVVEDGFHALAYDDRAFHPQTCPRCGALHEIDAPFDREVLPASEASRASGAFPDAAAFEARVRRIGAEVYAARGVQRVALRVEPGVPDVDDAGEPLLGSYEPYAAGLGGDEFLVTVYFRTFEKMWREDGPYDLDEELRETIDHELTHHLHHLAGHDPLDEAERAEVRRDLERTYGKGAVRRAARRAWLTNAAVVVGLVALLAAVLVLLDRLGVLH